MNHPIVILTILRFKNGWFHTNDLGWMDRDGYLYLTGRKSDMIISGGFNIYPNEVESIILQLKEISEVVVIGIPDEIWGEIVTAFVVFNKGMKLTQSQILDFLSKNNEQRPKLVIGFAAETNDLIKFAKEKKNRKNCDWIVANDVSNSEIGFDSEYNAVSIIYNNKIEKIEKNLKSHIANKIAKKIIENFIQ